MCCSSLSLFVNNYAFLLRLKKGGDGNNAVPSGLDFKLKRL